MTSQTEDKASTIKPYKETFNFGRFTRAYGTQLGMLGVFFGLWIIFIVSAPDTFLSSRVYFAFMSTIPFFAIMAIPLTMVVIAGEVDLGLQARDGLAIINGSNLLTAMSGLFLYDANNWLKQAEIAAAMSLEALKANMKPYNVKIHQARGFPGAVRSALAIQKCIRGGDLIEGKMKCKVQDAYSMRSTPQVIGAAHDALAYARSQVEIELNGVGDNPIFFPDENLQLSGANFQGSPVSLPMDMAGTAITMVSVLSERRMNRLNNPALNLRTTWEFFTSSDPSTITGEVDAFFADVENPQATAFARTLMADFQKYAHSLGSIDVYNQGFMADLHAACWSPGFKRLFDAVKTVLDPNGILNPGQWAGSYLREAGE